MMLHTEAKAFVFGCQVGRCVVRFGTVGALGRHVLVCVRRGMEFDKEVANEM